MELKHNSVDILVKLLDPSSATPNPPLGIVRRDGSNEVRYSVFLDLPSLRTQGFRLEPPRTGFPKHLRTVPPNRIGPSWLDANQRWSIIDDWIKACSTKHRTCQGRTSAKLPSRYLEIGSSDGDSIRVISSSGESGEYACLSHCWGGKNSCTLNTSTSSQFSRAIPPHLLPPIFIDAIGICRRLGLQKLWIDSLCIQQDSQHDWLNESQKMGAYYSNCTVCVAATSSPNSQGSMAIAKRPTAIRSRGTDPEKGDFDLVAHPATSLGPKTHFSQAYSHEVLLRDFPLLTRAWVLQEKWLSPRVLHFCGSEVAFECAEMTTCECGQSEQPGLSERTTMAHGLVYGRQPLGKLPWRYLVPAYSVLDLTRPSDRLIAVSGIARSLRNVWASEQPSGSSEGPMKYLAGLWQHTLDADLGWFVGPPLLQFERARSTRSEALNAAYQRADRRPRPSAYLGPSWSWAAVLSPVNYVRGWDILVPEQLFDVLDTHVNLANDDPFGSVAEGCYLHLRGNLLKTSYAVQSSRKDVPYSFELPDLVGTQVLEEQDRRGVYFSPDSDITRPGSDHIAPTTPLYVFPLSGQEVRWLSYANSLKFRSKSCLVLRKKEGGDRNGIPVYERVGFTEYSNFQDGTRNLDPNEYTTEEFIIL